MFLTKKHLSRRTLLKGAGVSLALPLLDAMIPAATALGQTAAARKLRAGFFYLPHGAVMNNTAWGPEMDRWTPSGSGENFKLNTITKPLEPFKKYVTSIGNLRNDAGAGTHTKRPGTWLTGTNPVNGSPYMSVDQVIADKIGQSARYPSLELASETTVQQAAGNGTATSITLAFRDAATPLNVEYNPRTLFYRLFSDGRGGLITQQTAKQEASLLDLINEQTRAMQRDLGPGDRAVLDDYLTSVREIEKRVAKRVDTNVIQEPLPEIPPSLIPDIDETVRFMFDIITFAFRTDMTRVVTFMMAGEGTNQTYNHIGIPDSFHPLSHHADDLGKLEKLVKIQTWHMERFASFLDKLATIRDGEGTLLDNALLLYGSNMSNSSRHDNHPLPTVVVGGAAGKLTGGRHLALPQSTPIGNLHLALLEKAGISRTTFGDSTGKIDL